MLRFLRDLLYYEHPVTIASRHSIPTSVELLAGASQRSAWSALFRDAVVGSVSADSIRLWRSRAHFRNGFRPIFVGVFQSDGRSVELRGHYRMSNWARGFMTVWLAFIALWTLIAIAMTVANPAMPWFPLFGLAMCAFGIGLVSFATRIGKGDEEWLSDLFRKTLQ